jgi:hypothetical protein
MGCLVSTACRKINCHRSGLNIIGHYLISGALTDLGDAVAHGTRTDDGYFFDPVDHATPSL